MKNIPQCLHSNRNTVIKVLLMQLEKMSCLWGFHLGWKEGTFEPLWDCNWHNSNLTLIILINMIHLFHIVSLVRYCISIGFLEQRSVLCTQGKTTISHHWLVSWHLVHILVHVIIQRTVEFLNEEEDDSNIWNKAQRDGLSGQIICYHCKIKLSNQLNRFNSFWKGKEDYQQVLTFSWLELGM